MPAASNCPLNLQIITIKMEAGPRGICALSITIGSLKTYDFKTSVDVVCT